ncbi:MAG: hypothetical protein ACO3Q3_04445, partial [Flavobacteriaceae bacterium]
IFADMSYFTPVWFERTVIFISLVFALWMISKVGAVSLKFKGLSLKENALRYMVIFSALVGLVVFGEEFVLILLPGYMLSSLLIKR